MNFRRCPPVCHDRPRQSGVRSADPHDQEQLRSGSAGEVLPRAWWCFAEVDFETAAGDEWPGRDAFQAAGDAE